MDGDTEEWGEGTGGVKGKNGNKSREGRYVDKKRERNMVRNVICGGSMCKRRAN